MIKAFLCIYGQKLPEQLCMYRTILHIEYGVSLYIYICVSLYIYIQISRGVVHACVIQLQVPNWMKVWIKIDAIPYPKSSRLCPSALHKRASFQLAPFKQRADLLSSSSHFLKNSIFRLPVSPYYDQIQFQELNIYSYIYFIRVLLLRSIVS